MPYVLGIDIGGVSTTAAVSRRQRAGWSPPEVVRLGAGSHAVPSVLYMAADGALTVDDPVPADPGRVTRGFTRRVGDDVPLLVGGEPCTPQALTAVLAMWVVEQVLAQEGEPAERVVIAHPASWGPYRRSLLHHALWEIGLTRVTLLPAPVVAAESLAAPGRAGDTLAVYSLGGSDFEASVVRRVDPGGVRLLGCPAPVDQVGGVDLDEALADHVQAALGPQRRELRRAGPPARLALRGLRRECAHATERLVTATETEVVVPLPHGRVRVPVTRAELEELVRPALQVTVDALTWTVRSCGLPPDQLDGVLLVGAAARLPLVAELVTAALPGPVTIGDEAWSAAATGAAVAAGKIATPPEPPGHDLMRTDEQPVVPPPDPDGRPDLVGAGQPGGGPPPRPPVAIAPLRLPRMRSGQRLFGLVGGRL